jgi:hypothetical protein
MRDAYRARVNRKLAEREADRREPLTTTQHILHLLLTVFTGGLWAPVWIVRARRGNRVWSES